LAWLFFYVAYLPASPLKLCCHLDISHLLVLCQTWIGVG